MQLSKLIRVSKVRIIGLFFAFFCTGHRSPAIFVTQQSTSGFGMFLYY